MSSTPLFEQASAQLNFLLLSERNMILLSAFSLALASFRRSFNHPLLRYFIVFLFAYAIAVGIKSGLDFQEFIKDVKEENLSANERKLIDNYSGWVYFTYTLTGLVIFILLTFTQIEFFNTTHKVLGFKK